METHEESMMHGFKLLWIFIGISCLWSCSNQEDEQIRAEMEQIADQSDP